MQTARKTSIIFNTNFISYTQVLSKCFHFPVIRNSRQELEISPCNRFCRQTGKCFICRHDNFTIWSYCASRWDSSTTGGNLLWYVFPVKITIWEQDWFGNVFWDVQGYHGTGKTATLDVHFPDRENTGNLAEILKIRFYTRHLPPTDVIRLWWDVASNILTFVADFELDELEDMLVMEWGYCMKLHFTCDCSL